jgi:hypothetical protein
MRPGPRSPHPNLRSMRRGPHSPSQGSRSSSLGARSPTRDIFFTQNELHATRRGSAIPSSPRAIPAFRNAIPSPRIALLEPPHSIHDSRRRRRASPRVIPELRTTRLATAHAFLELAHTILGPARAFPAPPRAAHATGIAFPLPQSHIPSRKPHGHDAANAAQQPNTSPHVNVAVHDSLNRAERKCSRGRRLLMSTTPGARKSSTMQRKHTL